MQEFMGTNNFIWWYGVVEDINDPLEMGRCRVRCFGFHSDDTNLVPVEALPWAVPVQPVTSAAKSGIGLSPTGLVQGSHVFGFFQDGLDAQQPVVVGSIAQIPRNAPSAKGFNDPTLTYPRSVSIDGSSTINEQDTSRLSRGVTQGTAVDIKLGMVEKEIPIAKKRLSVSEDDLERWDEPETPFNPLYPRNHVQQSESGHIIEIDDTPTRERLHTYHRSGTFEEIHPDGSKVTKVRGDNYELLMQDNNVHVSGNVNLVVGATGPEDGQGSNISIIVRGDANLQVDGDATAVVGNDLFADVKRHSETHCDGIYSVHAQEKIIFRSEGDILFDSPTECNITARGNINFKSGANGGKGVINLNPPNEVGAGGIEKGVPADSPGQPSVPSAPGGF